MADLTIEAAKGRLVLNSKNHRCLARALTADAVEAANGEVDAVQHFPEARADRARALEHERRADDIDAILADHAAQAEDLEAAAKTLGAATLARIAAEAREGELRQALDNLRVQFGNVLFNLGQSDRPMAYDEVKRTFTSFEGQAERALAAQPPRGDRVSPPEVCDGIEQPAFEAWAKSQGFDMHEHPLHYLFMDPRTDAARDGWKAGMRHVLERMNLSITEKADV